MMSYAIFVLAVATFFGPTVAGEVHGGVNFDVRWTNTTSPLSEAIKDAYEST